jgi:hypothetical protein
MNTSPVFNGSHLKSSSIVFFEARIIEVGYYFGGYFAHKGDTFQKGVTSGIK